MKSYLCGLICVLMGTCVLAAESGSFDKAASDAAYAKLRQKQAERDAAKKAATTQPATAETVEATIKQVKDLQVEVADLRKQVPADKLPKERKQLDTSKIQAPYTKANAQEVTDELTALRHEKTALTALLEKAAADDAAAAAKADAKAAGTQGAGGSAAAAGGSAASNGGSAAAGGGGGGGGKGAGRGGGGGGGRGGGRRRG